MTMPKGHQIRREGRTEAGRGLGMEVEGTGNKMKALSTNGR